MDNELLSAKIGAGSPEHSVHEPFRPLRLLSPQALAVEPEAVA